MPRSSRKRTRKKTVFTKGEINKLVDGFFHPLQRQHWAFEILDELAHFVIEGNPEESIPKFFRYSFPKILRSFMLDRDDENDANR